jgi:hypothetical protein
MRVYDWATVARPSWFISDGIHYTPQGYAERARGIADALALAFPAGQQPEFQPPTNRLSVTQTLIWRAESQGRCLVQ